MISRKKKDYFDKKVYPSWLAVPGLLIYFIIFVIPTFASFYFSLTRWDLKTAEFIGFSNFVTFFTMSNTKAALVNTIIYAFFTCGVKVVLGLLLANYLCSKQLRTRGYIKVMYFLPTLLGNVAVAIAFESLLSYNGLLNQFLAHFGIESVKWLTNSQYAMPACIIVDIWKGIGTALIIYISGISAIPESYFEAAAADGATSVQNFFKITLPLMVSSINTVLTLSLIGGLRSYELIYTMTGGGPGYATEVLGSIIYKLFSRGSYGLATAGYVIMFIIVAVIVFPLNSYVSKREAEL